jgi:AcrR family transcriptional regulator
MCEGQVVDAEPRSRRDSILATASEMFAEKGIATTTVREIADAVGVLSGSLYHHFESKDAMIDEIISGYLDTIRSRYADVLARRGSAAESLHDLVLASLRVTVEYPYATAMYQNESHYLRQQPRLSHIQSAATDVQRTWLKVIESGVADGSFRSDVPARVFYRLIRDAVWLSIRWHRPSAKYGTHALAKDVTSVFLSGFLAPAATEGRVHNSSETAGPDGNSDGSPRRRRGTKTAAAR